jgi:hypothetical protein
MIDWQWIVSVALGLLVVVLLVVAVFGVRWLRTSKRVQEIELENGALGQLLFFADLFVSSAQQQLAGIGGEDKLAWVTGALEELFPDVDEVTLRSAIEKAYLLLPVDVRKEVEPHPKIAVTGTSGVDAKLMV